MRRPDRREGFVLLAVLWVLAGGATLGLLLMLTSRDAQGTATNRIALTRARWMAEGCAHRARAAVEDATGEETISDSTWARLDRIIIDAPATEPCRLSVIPVGVTADVNAVSEEQLRSLFAAAGVAASRADSVAAAVADWRDADDVAREGGAERPWYDGAGRGRPRNAPLASVAEIAAVRGIEGLPEVAALLGVEPGRILLTRAPLAVLATLPGMSPSVLAVVEQRRTAGDSALDLPRLAASLPADARDGLLRHTSALTALATASPDAWLIAAEASDGSPPVTARLELRVVRSGRRLAVMRRRSDP